MKTKFMRGLALFLCLSMILGFVPGSFLHVHAQEIAPETSVDTPADGSTENETQHPSEGSLIANGNFDAIITDYAGAWKSLCGGYGNAGVVYDADKGSNVLKIYDPNGNDEAVRSAVELEGAKFPVVAGQNYDLSVKVKQDAAFADKAVGGVKLYVFWIDANGSFLDADGDGAVTGDEYYFSTNLPIAAEWTDLNATVTVPAGAVQAYLRFNTFVGDINCVYVDDVSFVRNPTLLTESFQYDIWGKGWTRTGGSGAMNYEHAYAGTKGLILQTNSATTATSPAIPAVPGFTYTAKFMHSKTFYTDERQAYGVGSGGRAKIYFVDENGAALEETVITVGEQNGWEEATLTARAPANTVAAHIMFFVDASYTGDPCFTVDELVITETVGEVLQPVEKPLLDNGDFEDGKNGWTGSATMVVVGGSHDDSNAMSIPVAPVNETNGNRAGYSVKSGRIAVTGGETMRLTAKAIRTANEARTGSEEGNTQGKKDSGAAYVGIWYVDADGKYVGDGAKATTINVDEWTDYTVEVTFPAGVAACWIELGVNSNSGAAFLIDDIAVEKVNADIELYYEEFDNTRNGIINLGWTLVNGKWATDIYNPWYEGGRSLHLQAAGASATSPIVDAFAGHTYKVDVMTLSVGGNPATMKLVFTDANGTVLAENATTVAEGAIYTSTDPGANWKADTLSAVAPEGTAKAYVVFECAENSNAMGIDNFKITMLAAEEEEEEDNTVVAPEYYEFKEGFDSYTSVYAGWTGDYTVTTEGMKLNGSASAEIPYIAGATYAAEATGAAAAVVDGQLVLTAENAVVSDYTVSLLCSATEGHNCDYCGTKLSDCVYDNDCDAMCNICQETRVAPHGELTYVPAKEAVDCQNPGNIEHYQCADCKEYFTDAEAKEPLNPWYITLTADCVRPEDAADCAVVPCTVCGQDTYGYGEHDVLACQGGTCGKCGAEVEGFGCANYDTPACEDGTCYYCGGFVAGFGHENGAWADCCDGECSYGCGLVYPATAEHIDEDADGYCDNCWNHINHTIPEGADLCNGYECPECWTWIDGSHTWADGVCGTCGTACDHDGLEEGTCEICGKELVVDLTGTEQAPVTLYDQTNAVTVSKAPYYYQAYFAGMDMTVTGTGDFSVIYNGETIAAVDGVVYIANLVSAGRRYPVVFAIDGIGDYTIAFSYPLGSMDNPAAAQLGDNAASIAVGSQGYFMTYTAEKDGKLVVTVSGDENWTYVINNLTTYQYGDSQWSDSDPVVNPAEIEVSAGDEIQIMVNGYDPMNPWTAPAAELNVNLAYAPEVPTVDENLKFYNVALNLGADIRGIFQVSYKNDATDYVAYKVIVDGVELELVSTYSNKTTTYLGFALTKVAKEMADEVTAVVYGITAEGTAVEGETMTWSIKQGAFAMLDERASKDTEIDRNQMILIANMLNYGAEAQKNFGYNTENLATDGLKDEYKALILTTAPEMNTIPKADETGATATLYNVSLNLGERVQVLPLFKVGKNQNAADYKAVVVQKHTKADGTVVENTFDVTGEKLILDGSYLAVYLDNIASNELRDTLTVTLYKNDVAVSAAQTCSAESACSTMLASYPDLIPALMNYGDCAKVVFG